MLGTSSKKLIQSTISWPPQSVAHAALTQAIASIIYLADTLTLSSELMPLRTQLVLLPTDSSKSETHGESTLDTMEPGMMLTPLLGLLLLSLNFHSSATPRMVSSGLRIKISSRLSTDSASTSTTMAGTPPMLMLSMTQLELKENSPSPSPRLKKSSSECNSTTQECTAQAASNPLLDSCISISEAAASEQPTPTTGMTSMPSTSTHWTLVPTPSNSNQPGQLLMSETTPSSSTVLTKSPSPHLLDDYCEDNHYFIYLEFVGHELLLTFQVCYLLSLLVTT